MHDQLVFFHGNTLCWQGLFHMHPWLMGLHHVTGQWAVIAQGAYTAAPLSAALPDIDVYPLLGPMGGGTEVMLEVRCLRSLQPYCMRQYGDMPSN